MDPDKAILADILISFLKLEPPTILNAFFQTFCKGGRLTIRESGPTSTSARIAPEKSTYGCYCNSICPACDAWKKDHLENIVNFIVYYRPKEEREEYWGGVEAEEVEQGSWIGTEDWSQAPAEPSTETKTEEEKLTDQFFDMEL